MFSNVQVTQRDYLVFTELFVVQRALAGGKTMVSTFSRAGRNTVGETSLLLGSAVKPASPNIQSDNSQNAEQKHHPLLVQAKALQEKMSIVRRKIHAHPELAFEEQRTSSLMKDCLRSAGFTVQSSTESTGIIADLNRGAKRTIAIKTEMDALPITELNQVMYRSQIANAMHACGHDAHMAAVCGAAEILSAGSNFGVRLIVQPGEHASDECDHKGASQMIADGALNDIDAILGFHIDATMPLGQVGVMESVFFNLRSEFKIQFGLGSDSMESVTTVLSGIQDLNKKGKGNFRIQNINARNQEASIEGFFNCDDLQMRDQQLRMIQELCASTHTKYQLSVSSNDSDLDLHKSTIACAYESSSEILGAASTYTIKRRTWTREFAEYAAIRPAAFLLFGTHVQGQRSIQHTASFDFDESVMASIAAVISGTVLKLQKAL